ncbi:helix-turn-helix transcriptional regulator [Pseudomonas kermanshahensis]|jgi:transcriptional regulator with XRE-family HTH domain|uniref:Helix-turn-helix transcriptional regulator n=1 Tax=Pseudomonas kermanshahensis TaxID=2745482 RepID=A0ABU8R237_9PSED
MTTLAQRIKAARGHAKLTQRALALKVGVEQPVISQLETGKNLQSAHLSKIAHVCGVNSIWLSDEIGPMTGSYPSDEQEALSRAEGIVRDRSPGDEPEDAFESVAFKALQNLKGVVTPRSLAVIKRIETAALAGRLKETDLVLLEGIAARFEELNKDQP